MTNEPQDDKPENLVRYKFDPKNPYRMTPEEKARLDAIRDEDIDYSDIPETADFTGWTRPGITLYVDDDIARYFRTNDGLRLDRERITQILRGYIAAHPKDG
jgi:hypothetical protein